VKATYRSVGIKASGGAIYQAEHRKGWLEKLQNHPHLHQQANRLFGVLDAVEQMKQETFTEMVRRARKVLPAYRLLKEIPGVGPVLATGYIAMLQTPHRFSKKNKLWRYAGLGNVLHKSDEAVYRQGPSKSGNRVLKWLDGQHFQGAVQRGKKSNRFKRAYQQAIRRGLSRQAARRQICRCLLSVVRAIWMKEEPYSDGP